MAVDGTTDEKLPSAKKASTPFDDPAADTILRTCDGVDFYIYRIILSLSSPFFKSMFSLKQPTSPTGVVADSEGQPIIDVQENSQTLDQLLRLCYPIPDPSIQSLGDVGDILEAAMKYEMEQPTILMKKLLRDGTEHRPLQAYAVACRLDMEEEAAAAARTWKATMPFIPELPVGRSGSVDWSSTVAGQTYVDEMSQVTAGAYFRLLRFIRMSEVPRFCASSCAPSAEATTPLESITPTLHSFDIQKVDLIIRSSDGIDFPVHRIIIAFASCMLETGTALPPSPKSLPAVQVDGHSAVLDLIIQLCYPLEDPKLEDVELAIRLLCFATKYRAKRAKDFVRHHLPSFVDLDPLRMFFIAAQHGWEAEARTAVMHVLHSDVGSCYVPEMEQVSARVYRAFLKHHYECFRTVANITYRDTGTLLSVPKGSPGARQCNDYARVAPVIYAPTMNHAISFIKSNHFHISYDIEAIRNDSERILDEIQEALSEVPLEI